MPDKSISSDSNNMDWKQVRETIVMLNLAVAQIDNAMKEGDDSVTMLAKLVSSIMDKVQSIGVAIESLPDSGVKKTAADDVQTATKKMETAIVAFQFYDKLMQRLSHVNYSLSFLGNLINDPEKRYDSGEWGKLQELIKSKYPIAADREMFEAILKGATVEEALEQRKKAGDIKEADDKVEMF